MKCIHTDPLRNTSITTLCASGFYDQDTDSAIHKHTEKLFGDLWRAGVNWSIEFKDGSAIATVCDAGGGDWQYAHDYAIVALAGAAEMASGRHSFIDYEPYGVGQYDDCPTSMLEYEKNRIQEPDDLED